MILPSSTIGLVGGGQLGRYLLLSAQQLGYRVMVLDPDPNSPAGRLADEHLCAAFDDEVALQRMGEACAVVTTEWENVPASILQQLEKNTLVRPSSSAVAKPQDRIQEKRFIQQCGLRPAPFDVIESDADLKTVSVTYPAILKLARMGYDGKGQVSVVNAKDLEQAWMDLGRQACVLEQKVDLDKEISVIVARNQSGEPRCFPIAENEHRGGILHRSIVPARIDQDSAEDARIAAIRLAQELVFCGVMAVEFFVDRQGELLVNEIAPRTHNSGHYTLDACATSQFEQQLRMLCDLPFGDMRLISPAVMVNLLGDLWGDESPHWNELLAEPNVKLHCYGKLEPRKGRKMGHFTVMGERVESLCDQAEALFKRLA